MIASLKLGAAAWVLLAFWPIHGNGRHVLLDAVLSDNPPPGQSDASCAHLVRAGLDEGVGAKGRPLVERAPHGQRHAQELVAVRVSGCERFVENAFQMEQRSITKNLNEIKSALESGKPVQSISPAFEWAQSGEWVYINAKMSHKLDAPATLNVVSEGVEMSDRSLKFAASKDHKRFALDLALHANIDPDPSSISWGSVGRVTFTLKKATGGVVWPSLLAEGQKKPVNMHVWWSKQEEYADEIDAIEEAVSEAAAAKTSKSGGDDAAGVQAAADASGEGVGAAAAAGDEGKGERESKPMTAEERMEKAKKEVSTAFSKEKKARFEELEREKRAAAKSIDAEATAKKKQAEEALRMKKAVVDEQFEELVQKKHAEIKAAAQASDRTEL
ncbi:unnamed protein product [Ascophyllum nodosum]